jgi:hypothetical protein
MHLLSSQLTERSVFASFAQVVDTVLAAFGVSSTTPGTTDLLHFGEIINCFSTHKSLVPNVELPVNFVKAFDTWRDKQFFHKYHQSHAAELGSGRLLQEIASQLAAPIQSHGAAPYKFAQYSCHDTSLCVAPLPSPLSPSAPTPPMLAKEWPSRSLARQDVRITVTLSSVCATPNTSVPMSLWRV